MTQRTIYLISVAVWFLFGVYYLWESFNLTEGEAGMTAGMIGPTFYPVVLSVLVILLALLLLANLILFPKFKKPPPGRKPPTPAADGPEGGSPTAAAEVAKRQTTDWITVQGAVIALVAYTALLNGVGFLILTPILLFGLMWLLRERRWILLIGAAFGLSFGLFFIFQKFVKVLLPEGVWF